jgi:hypothetical protein
LDNHNFIKEKNVLKALGCIVHNVKHKSYISIEKKMSHNFNEEKIAQFYQCDNKINKFILQMKQKHMCSYYRVALGDDSSHSYLQASIWRR